MGTPGSWHGDSRELAWGLQGAGMGTPGSWHVPSFIQWYVLYVGTSNRLINQSITTHNTHTHTHTHKINDAIYSPSSYVSEGTCIMYLIL